MKSSKSNNLSEMLLNESYEKINDDQTAKNFLAAIANVSKGIDQLYKCITSVPLFSNSNVESVKKQYGKFSKAMESLLIQSQHYGSVKNDMFTREEIEKHLEPLNKLHEHAKRTIEIYLMHNNPRALSHLDIDDKNLATKIKNIPEDIAFCKTHASGLEIKVDMAKNKKG